MQHNFILTDLMRTGPHQDLEDFIDMANIHDQTFTYTGDYYSLHNFDLDKYQRKFAIIDYRIDLCYLADSKTFKDDFMKRVELLKSQGFVFIRATPWESLSNLKEPVLAPANKSGVDGYYFPNYPIEHIQWTGDISWFWFYMYRQHHKSIFTPNHNQKKYDFLYLNKGRRQHRTRLFSKLISTTLLENSLFSNHNYVPRYILPTEYEENYPMRGADQNIDLKHYNDTKYSIISETNDSNDEIFMTEKIWKPILAEHVFIVHGNHLYLQKLRELGFKTFNNYFDESYDLEPDKNIRIDKIVSLISNLKNKDWQDLYLQTKGLRQHNKDLFLSKEKLQEQINKTLIRFLEFADSSQITS